MDILEAGMDRPERPPSRPRTVALAVIGVVIAGAVYVLNRPASSAGPEPVATATSPRPSSTSTRTRRPQQPQPTTSPTTRRIVAVSCDRFLDQLRLPDLGVAYGNVRTDKRTAGKRVITYVGYTETITLTAACGPTIWPGPVGQHIGDDNERYLEPGATSDEPSGPRKAVAVWRAPNADGYYWFEASAPTGVTMGTSELYDVISAVERISA
ncbi:MAG: hypothetical protein JWM93_2730 [Frankiales bacterium]|nr:hypothetical protein [Frankiales bacterium]